MRWHTYTRTHIYTQWESGRADQANKRQRVHSCSRFCVSQLHPRTRKVWVCPHASKQKACCRWKNMDSQFLQQIYRLETISNHQVMHLVCKSDAPNRSGPSYLMISIKFRCLFVFASIRLRSFTVPLGELNRWITGRKSNSQCIWSGRERFAAFPRQNQQEHLKWSKYIGNYGSGRKFESFHSSTSSHLPTHHLLRYSFCTYSQFHENCMFIPSLWPSVRDSLCDHEKSMGKRASSQTITGLKEPAIFASKSPDKNDRI